LKPDIGVVFIFISFFYAYFGVVCFIVYPVLLLLLRYRFSRLDWFVLGLLSFQFALSVVMYGFFDVMIVYRFNWGFLFFYLFFVQYDIYLSFKKILLILLLLVVLEFVLINFFISAKGLPNYPDPVLGAAHFSSYDMNGVFQRPYSFGGNSSVTAVLLVAIFSFLDLPASYVLFTAVTVFLVGSGSGYYAFLISLINRRRVLYFLLVFFILFIPIVFGFYGEYLSGFLDKASFDYVKFLYGYKVHQFIEAYSVLGLEQKMFGLPLRGKMGGDFVALSFLVTSGWVGSALFIFFFLFRMNRLNWLPLLIIVLFTFHYYVLFSLPGQILFGYFLAIKSQPQGRGKFNAMSPRIWSL